MKSKEEIRNLVWGGMRGGVGLDLARVATEYVTTLLTGDLPENPEEFDEYMRNGLEGLFDEMTTASIQGADITLYQLFKNKVYELVPEEPKRRRRKDPFSFNNEE